MKNDPLISVIIPIHKVEPYLRQCLDSVIRQTYKNLEIIAVDDGSPDNCGAILDEYAANDERIIAIHKQNGGLSAARNDGMAIANGQWLSFIDSDDWIDADYYKNFVIRMEAATANVMIADGRIEEYPDRHIRKRNLKKEFLWRLDDNLRNQFITKLFVKRKETEVFYGENSLIAPWDKLYSRNFLKNNDLKFDTEARALEDLIFNLNVMLKAETVSGHKFCGYHYRMLETSISKAFNIDKPYINYYCVSKVYECLGKRIESEDLKNALHAFVLDALALNRSYLSSANNMPYKEIAKAVRELKNKPYFNEVIWAKSNVYLRKPKIVLKYLLRLPWIWPLMVAYIVKRAIVKDLS